MSSMVYTGASLIVVALIDTALALNSSTPVRSLIIGGSDATPEQASERDENVSTMAKIADNNQNYLSVYGT